MTVAAAVLTLVMLGVIFKLIIGGKGTFSLTRAMQPINSLGGEAVGRLLSILTIITVVVTTDVVPVSVGQAWGAPAVLATAIGAAVAPRLTDRLLSVLGIGLAVAATAQKYGGQTALLVLVIAMLAVWITGLIRGFTGR